MIPELSNWSQFSQPFQMQLILAIFSFKIGDFKIEFLRIEGHQSQTTIDM